ncbi:MAG: polyprenyl synthetase family protein [Kiritimatiellae bacterium]|nr:polyprenyl synthetase family protein [Kiritimatiellia bacterium]
MPDFVTQAGPLRELVETELAKLFTPAGLLADADVPPGLAEPMRYALLGGGKRLRPVLCLAACQAVCGDPAPALPAALAIEVLHNYTLVHDDLPCMDADALRRGRPTVHAKYGYAQAVLVGDALQAAAFQLALAPQSRAEAAVARALARAAGPAGVVGGQWVDVTAAPPHDDARVAYVHAHKTGDLIACACEMGALAATAAGGGSGESSPVRCLRSYGRALGLAFQIVDDLLDAGDPAKAGELSILRVCAPAEARERARAATRKALAALDSLAALSGVGAPPESPGGRTPTRPAAAALALLRALAEDQLSRTL